MPIYDLSLPDGRTLTLEAPDESAAMGAASQWHQANPPMTAGDRLADVGKSLGTGAANLVSGVAGLPGDVQSLARSGSEWLAGRNLPSLPSDPTAQLPTSGDVRGQIEKWAGPLHQPQTAEGKLASAAVEFLPGAALPGGPARRLLNVAGPAVGSEVGGAVAKGMDIPEGYGKLVGGVAGGFAPSALGRMVTPFPASQSRTAAVNALRDEGVTVTAGQATGRKGLQAFESEMGGGRGADMMTRQSEQFTAAALRRIGETGTRADADTLNRAYTRIGDQLKVVDRHALNVDKKFTNDIATLQGTYSQFANPNQSQTVHSAVNDIVNVVQRNNGSIPGDQYRVMRSRIGDAMRSARTSGDNQVANAYSDMIQALDDAMERSVSVKSDLNSFREARRHYRDFLTIERAVTNSAGAAGEGLITPAALTNAIKANEGRRSLALGRSNFDELAKAGAQVMAPLPNSGTPIRTRAGNLGMSPVGAGAGGSIGGLLTGGNPFGIGAGAAIGGYGPRVVGAASMTGPGQAFLGNQGLAGFLNNAPPQLQQALINAIMARPQSQSLVALPQGR